MGLIEDLDALTFLNADQLAGFDTLAQMTAKQRTAFAARVDAAWDRKVEDVQAAKRDLAEAADAYTAACRGYAATINSFRPRLLMRQLTEIEAEIEAEAAALVAAAHVMKAAAEEALEEAKTRFKQAMTAEQLGA